MSTINYIKTDPTTFLMRFKKGKLKQSGRGLAFWYYAPNTALVAISTASRDHAFMFKELTADFQEVSIQGQVIYRVAEPEKLAEMMNFTLNPNGKGYATDDPEKFHNRILSLIQVTMRNEIEKIKLMNVLNAGNKLVKEVKHQLSTSTVIDNLGVEVLDLAILAIKPTPDTARALESQVREQILQEADDAIYRRRNAAIEQEREVKENELKTELSIEAKQFEIEQEKLNAERSLSEQRNLLEEEVLAAKIKRERTVKESELATQKLVQEERQKLKQDGIKAERKLLFERQAMDKDAIAGNIEQESQREALVQLTTENAKKEAEAKAYDIEQTMIALSKVDSKVLEALTLAQLDPQQMTAQAFREMVAGTAKIGQLNLSPDILETLSGRRLS